MRVIVGESVAILLLILAIGLVTWIDRRMRRQQGPDVGLAVFEPELDEDINAPSLDVIDAALILTTDPAARNYLLDKRIDAMRRVS